MVSECLRYDMFFLRFYQLFVVSWAWACLFDRDKYVPGCTIVLLVPHACFSSWTAWCWHPEISKLPSAGCTRMFCEYAKEFVAAMQKVGGEMDHEDQWCSVWVVHCRLIEQKCVCHKESPHCNASAFNLKNRIIFSLYRGIGFTAVSTFEPVNMSRIKWSWR